MIYRYDPSGRDIPEAGMIERDDGRYVEYKDYDRLRESLKRISDLDYTNAATNHAAFDAVYLARAALKKAGVMSETQDGRGALTLVALVDSLTIERDRNNKALVELRDGLISITYEMEAHNEHYYYIEKIESLIDRIYKTLGAEPEALEDEG